MERPDVDDAREQATTVAELAMQRRPSAPRRVFGGAACVASVAITAWLGMQLTSRRTGQDPLDQMGHQAEAMLVRERTMTTCRSTEGNACDAIPTAWVDLSKFGSVLHQRLSSERTDVTTGEVWLIPRCDDRMAGTTLLYRSPRSPRTPLPPAASRIGEGWYTVPGCELVGEGI